MEAPGLLSSRCTTSSRGSRSLAPGLPALDNSGHRHRRSPASSKNSFEQGNQIMEVLFINTSDVNTNVSKFSLPLSSQVNGVRTREAAPRSPGPVKNAPVARPRRIHILIRDAAPSTSSEGQGRDTAFEEAECWSQSEEEEEAGGGNPAPAAVTRDGNLASGRHRYRQCSHSAHGHNKQQTHARTAMTADSALSTAWWREWSDFMNQTAPVHHNMDRNVIKADRRRLCRGC